MKKSKHTKRALLLSITSLMICLIMLVSSTFAWFSDTASSGRNKIEAGNLDVELYRLTADGEKELVTEDTRLFDIELWEPGAVVYETFEVDNLGDLALKYRLAINIVSYNTIKDNGKSLKDVLQVNVINGEFTGNREDVFALEDPFLLPNFQKQGILNTREASNKFTVFIYWQQNSDTDNDYNLNNNRTTDDGEPLFVELGVDLTATQSPSEQDSFGIDYDDTTSYIEVGTADEFLNNIYFASGDQGVKLTNDISFPYYIPYSIDGITKIDLNGHTISTSVDTGSLVPENTTTIIKNGKINLRHRSVDQSGIDVGKNSTLILENVELTNNTAAGIFARGDSTVTILDSKITTYGFAITTNASNSSFHNPTINIVNSTISGMDDDNGAKTAILVNVPCHLSIENSTINGFMQGIIVRGGTANIENSTITNTVNETVATNFAPSTFANKNWGSGNELPAAALVIGNKSDKYQYPAEVTLVNTKIISTVTGSTTLPDIYMFGNATAGMGATLTYDESSSVGNIERGNEFTSVSTPGRP